MEFHLVNEAGILPKFIEKIGKATVKIPQLPENFFFVSIVCTFFQEKFKEPRKKDEKVCTFRSLLTNF
jgi:hypothetical protein